jgi:hypothetical protein
VLCGLLVLGYLVSKRPVFGHDFELTIFFMELLDLEIEFTSPYKAEVRLIQVASSCQPRSWDMCKGMEVDVIEHGVDYRLVKKCYIRRCQQLPRARVRRFQSPT